MFYLFTYLHAWAKIIGRMMWTWMRTREQTVAHSRANNLATFFFLRLWTYDLAFQLDPESAREGE